jgi:hypothetical protein
VKTHVISQTCPPGICWEVKDGPLKLLVGECVAHAQVGLIRFEFRTIKIGSVRYGRLSIYVGNDCWKCEDFSLDNWDHSAPIEEVNKRVNLLLSAMKESLR